MDVAQRFAAVRRRTVELAAPLTVEDQVIQTMPEASPTKWHLAHTTWFFETFVLAAKEPFDPAFAFLFNSYYEAVGPRVQRPRRGMLSRPPLERVHAYRAAVDKKVAAALAERTLDAAALERLELGLQHEQQHQELLLTDAKHVLGTQPTRPAYRGDLPRAAAAGTPAPSEWRAFAGGIVEIGAATAAGAGFAFDNERPRHRTLLGPFKLATRPLANRDVQAFIADGGYRDHRLWLSDGWATVQAGGWTAPLYWDGDATYELAGVRAIAPDEPACHLSCYEADAIARWAGARLPTEAEWELAAAAEPVAGNFVESGRLHPVAGSGSALFGDVWEWTASAYAPYPGFQPLAGALGEYNGKFMSGQQVLRGGSCFTPRDHVRASYRNFFPPQVRWQMSGARLAMDG